MCAVLENEKVLFEETRLDGNNEREKGGEEEEEIRKVLYENSKIHTRCSLFARAAINYSCLMLTDSKLKVRN